MHHLWQGHCRGGPPRPPRYSREFLQNNNSVNVVGHYHKLIDAHARVIPWKLAPRLLNHFARFIASHLASNDVSKQKLSVLRADGYEIKARRSVIITLRRIERREGPS